MTKKAGSGSESGFIGRGMDPWIRDPDVMDPQHCLPCSRTAYPNTARRHLICVKKFPFFRDAFLSGGQEKLVYIPCIVPDKSRPDYLVTVDVDPKSPTYSQVIRELHCKEVRIRIRIHRIHMFLGLRDPNPDPLLRGMDHAKIVRKILIPTVF
jgi:hypothetical protein